MRVGDPHVLAHGRVLTRLPSGHAAPRLEEPGSGLLQPDDLSVQAVWPSGNGDPYRAEASVLMS